MRERLQAVKVAVMTTLLEQDQLDAMAAGVIRDLVVELGWDSGAIFEPEDGELRVRASYAAPDTSARAPAVGARVPRGTGSRGMTFAAARAHREDLPAGAAMWIPIIPRDGRMVGLAELTAAGSHAPPPVALDELVELLQHVGACFEKCRTRDRIDRELRMSQSQLARLHTSDLIGFMVSTTDGRILQANDAFLRMLQRPRAELETGALRWDNITPASSLAADQRAIEQLIAHGVAPTFEKEYIRADGSRVPVLLGAALLSVDPMTTVVFAVDITAQKRVERKLEMLNAELEMRVADRQAALRALAARLHSVREEQLAELAREIHDVFGQELTVLKVDVGWLARRLAETDDDVSPLVHERLEHMVARLDGLFATVRRMSTELRPRILDDLGLVAAIESHARGLARRTGLVIELALPEELPLDHDLATALYRIYQELVTNVIRHARARHVDVSIHSIHAHAEAIELRVADDGLGFELEQVGSSSLGLLGIRERALAFGGAFSIARRAAGGTVATVAVPLGARKEMTP